MASYQETKTFSGANSSTKNIKGNGRKKLLIVGKTGTGKSSLCNAISGHEHDDDLFETSPDASSCTQMTQFANVFFGNDKSKPISIIDTIGFDDPKNDADANIISELVLKLQNHCDHVNLFLIVINGQNPRLDGALMGMIRIFEGMFGEEFWHQALLVFTRLPMDKKAVRKRNNITKKTDDDLAKAYLKTLEKEFPKGGGLDYLSMDACYDRDGGEEELAFKSSMDKLWERLNNARALPTYNVRKVETESKKLKNMLEEKDNLIKQMDDKRKEMEENVRKTMEESERKYEQERNRLLLDLEKSDLKTQKALLEQQAEMDKKYENWKKEVEKKSRREREEMEKLKDEALKTSTSSRAWPKLVEAAGEIGSDFVEGVVESGKEVVDAIGNGWRAIKSWF